MYRSWLRAAAVAFLTAGLASAASSVAAVRTERPPVIDGVLADQEWEGATRFNNFLQFEPWNGQPTRLRTTAYFLYNNTHVYFGVYAQDDRPEQITARLTRRDGALNQDDSVYIFLDTFHDRRTCY
ncbi:MAG: hypothetical protein EHM65_09960, partial [Acidobacteriales bacterium]